MFGSSSGGKMVDILPNSERTVTCIGPVEGFSLEAEDLEFMCRQFSKTLLSDEVQRALKWVFFQFFCFNSASSKPIVMFFSPF